MDGLAHGGRDVGHLGLGDALRRAREERGLTLDQAAEATRIRLVHLLALEEEDFASLPAPVFARGLLRAYARYLGLDDEQVVGFLDSHNLLVTQARVVSEVPRARRTESSLPRTLAVTLAILLLGALGYYLYSQYSAFMSSEGSVASLPTPVPAVAASLPTPAPTVTAARPQPTTAPTPVSPVSTPSPMPTPTPVPSPTPTPTPLQTITVEARFSGRSWVHVEVDDQIVLDNWFSAAGDRRTWTGKKVYLWVGNAGAVDIMFNGKPQGRLGALGEVVKTTWTAS